MKGDTNFGLFVIGLVAVVALAGMLNFDGISGKAVGGHSCSEVIDSGVTYYCCESDCDEECGSCIGVKTYKASESKCPNNMFSDAKGTYYMHYFCG